MPLSRLVAAALAALLVPAALAGPAVEAPSGNQLVVKLSQGFGGIAGDHWMTVEIFGDGRVLVQRPAFSPLRQKAEIHISRAEVVALLETMADEGVFEFDEAAVKAQVAGIRKQRIATAHRDGRMAFVMTAGDPDPVILEVHASSLVPEGGGPVQTNVTRVVRYRSVSVDARQFPEVGALGGLDRALAAVTPFLSREELK